MTRRMQIREIDAMLDRIVAEHNDYWHPGFECVENERIECVDRFGGAPVPGPLGERRPLRTTRPQPVADRPA